jgi:hypothetical protein
LVDVEISRPLQTQLDRLNALVAEVTKRKAGDVLDLFHLLLKALTVEFLSLLRV